MKTISKLFILLFSLSLTVGCTQPEDIMEESFELKKTKIDVNHGAKGLDQDRYITMKTMDLTLHYRIIGKGPIDVVFLPGWTNPLTVYTKQFDYFRDKARCIYVDLPGQGLSDAPQGLEYTQELMAEAVYDIVKKEGLHRFVAVGFSMGPRVWGMFERNYPGMIKKLVVSDGGFDPWPTDSVERQARIDIREATLQAQQLWTPEFKTLVMGSLIPPDLVGEEAEALKEWGTYFINFPSDILANIYYHYDAENANEPVGWSYPKLCFYSDPNPNMDKVNWIYPNNTVYTFPGGGHVIHWIFHEEINPLILEFITDKPWKKHTHKHLGRKHSNPHF